MTSKELAVKVIQALYKKKVADPLAIEVEHHCSFADYLIVVSGSSLRQVGSIASDMEDLLAEEGVLCKSVEGKKESGWILQDFGDIIINVFSPEMRERYALESVWRDCPILDVPREEEE